MLIHQDGVRVYILPDDAHCTKDDEKRSPIDLDECPYGHETCTGDCIYYTEEAEPDLME